MWRQILLCSLWIVKATSERPYPFFGDEEYQIRMGPFAERALRIPRASGFTPAFLHHDALVPHNEVTLLMRPHSACSIMEETRADSLLQTLWSHLLKAGSVDSGYSDPTKDERLEADVIQWVSDWTRLHSALRAASGRHGLNSRREEAVSDLLGLVIPIHPKLAWKSFMALESLQYLELYPSTMTIIISGEQKP